MVVPFTAVIVKGPFPFGTMTVLAKLAEHSSGSSHEKPLLWLATLVYQFECDYPWGRYED